MNVITLRKMLERIEDLKKKIKGIKAIILVKDGKIAISDFDVSETKKISNSIYYLIDTVKDKKDFGQMMVESKNGKFFVFYHQSLFLAVLCDVEINYPLLKLLAMRDLKSLEVEEVEEISEEETEDIDKRAKNFL